MNWNALSARLEGWYQDTLTVLLSVEPAELVAGAALPLLAILLGLRIKRYVSRKPSITLHARLMEFASPLLSPTLAILFVGAALALLHAGEYPALFLGFVFKLTIAWFAVKLVMILTNGHGAGLFIGLIIIPITLMHLFGIWEPTVTAMSKAEFTLGSITLNLYQIAKGILALMVLLWVTNFVVSLTEARLKRVRNMRASSRTLILKFAQIGLYILAFIIGMQIIGVSLTTLSIFSGALGVGIGFGLQKIASNFISGIILLFEKSVEADDLVQMEDGTLGFVRHTGARYTLLETFDKRDIFVPNEEFIVKQVVNLTHMDRSGRAEVTVGVSYDSDLPLVQRLMEQAASQVERCLKDPAPGAFVTGFGDSSINLILYFWVEDVGEGRVGPMSECMVNIIELFREHNVTIPFPHQVQVADPVYEARMSHLEEMVDALGQKTPAQPKRARKPAAKKSTPAGKPA